MLETQVTQTEPEGVPARPVITIAVGFLIFVAACLAGLFLLLQRCNRRSEALKVRGFPGPPTSARAALRSRTAPSEGAGPIARIRLGGQGAGHVRIPIERAMQIVASKGAAAFGSWDDLNKAPPPPKGKNETAKAVQQSPAQNGVQR